MTKGRQTALMPGNGDKVGYWLTPPDLMARLEAEFHFDFDAAPYPRPAGFDGLKEEWGNRTWLNPPFYEGSSIMPWARKAKAECEKGKLVVLILPVVGWLQPLLEAGAEIRWMDHIAWASPKGDKLQRSSRPSCLFVLRPKAALEGGDVARGARSPSVVSPLTSDKVP